MVNTPFRDGDASEARLQALDDEIAHLEASFTPIFWERVAARWELLPVGRLPAGDPLDRRHRRLTQLRETLERARHGPHANAELPPPGVERRGLLDRLTPSEQNHENNPSLQLLIAELGLDASTTLPWRRSTCWATRLRMPEALGDAPLDVEFLLPVSLVGNVPTIIWRLQTSVAPTLTLALREEGSLQDIWDFFGVHNEIEIGDARFDPRFVIRGDETSAKAILTADIRAELLGLNISGMSARDGVMALERRGVPEAGFFSRASRLLCSLHELVSPFPLCDVPAGSAGV